MNFVVSNSVKRVLHIIREACTELKIQQEPEGGKQSKRRLDGMKDFGKRISIIPKMASDDSSLLKRFDDSPDPLQRLKNKNLDRKTTMLGPKSSEKLFHSMQTLTRMPSQDSHKSHQLTEKESRKRKTFINNVLLNIEDMLQDIEGVYDEITRQAPEHINQKDIIMTFSQSDLLISFLDAAHNGTEEQPNLGKNFEVLVCETAPHFSGHLTAKELQKAGI